MDGATIQSAQFGCYLRMYAPKEIVNCQFTAGELETFIIHEQADRTITIESKAYPGNFLNMNGEGVTRRTDGGGGHVASAHWAREWEKLRLVWQDDGTCAIESVRWPGVFLRMDGSNVDHFLPDGGGVVNCQFGVSAWEKFKLPKAVGLTADELRTAIKTYGPRLMLSGRDPYRMCSIGWFLQQSTLIDTQTGQKTKSPTVDQLPTSPERTDRYELWLDLKSLPGDQRTARAYVHAFWQPWLSYTDIQFWFIYAFNGPSIVDIGVKVVGLPEAHLQLDAQPLGTHPGDIEYCVIRVDNKTKKLVGVVLSQHDTSAQYYGERLKDLEYVPNTGRPKVYSAALTHAVFPHPGPNPYGGWQPDIKIAKADFSIANNCDGDGPWLDCNETYEIVSAPWLGNAFPEPKWVNYPSRWGYIDEIKPPTYDDILEQLEKQTNKAVATVIAGSFWASYKVWYFNKQDTTGPEGPKYKDQWYGNY